MGEQNALKVFSLTSTGPGMCSLTCGIKIVREIFHKRMQMASFIRVWEKSAVPKELFAMVDFL